MFIKFTSHFLGADLKERAQMTQQQATMFVKGLRSLMNKIQYLPVPIIAALDGSALGLIH